MSPLLMIIVDESLSMRSRKYEILDGINQFIDVQRKVNSEESRLILVKFNNSVTFLHKGNNCNKITIISNANGSCFYFDQEPI